MDHFLTIEEAAEILKLHPKTVRKKIQSGEIQASRVGRQYRISEKYLRDLGSTGGVSDKPDSGSDFEVTISTILDVDSISREESIRLTNTIMAVMNQGAQGSRVDCIYYESTGKFRIAIHGMMETVPEILLMIRGLLTPGEGPFSTGYSEKS